MRRCYRIVTGSSRKRYGALLDWISQATKRPCAALAPGAAGSGDPSRNPPSGGPVLTLFETELACAAAWALTGGVWYCLGAVLCGAALVFVVLFGRG